VRASISRLAVVLLAACGSGCVTFYQPLAGLQEPVVIDPQEPNFTGLKVLVRCLPDEVIDAKGAELVCKRVKALLTIQGAVVETQVPRPGRELMGKATPADLVVDLRSRLLHQESSALQTILSVVTLTLLPIINEYSVAQEVKIRDPEGFLLASESLEARFEQEFGLGVFVVQSLIDLIFRSAAEKLTGDAPRRDFSRDLYGQLSQLVLDAQVRSRVLHQFDHAGAKAGP
jgi:hypothetical protein